MIIFHGIFSNAENMNDLTKLIQKYNPGTDVHNIDGYDDLESVAPMWEQVASIRSKMLPIMTKATDGVHMICYSQGKDLYVRV